MEVFWPISESSLNKGKNNEKKIRIEKIRIFLRQNPLLYYSFFVSLQTISVVNFGKLFETEKQKSCPKRVTH
jgi:hypothetical protein